MNSIPDFDIEKCILIKKLVQRLSGFADIGVKNRIRDFADLKKIYCMLCHELTGATRAVIGKALRKDYNHATVTHCIRKFEILYVLKQLNFIKVYDKAFYILNNSIEDFELNSIDEKIINDLHFKIEILEYFILKQNL